MPNIGPAELVIILVIALLILGPGRLPDVASALGKSIREFRKAASDVQDTVNLAATTAPPAAPGPGPAAQALAPVPQAAAAAPAPNTLAAAEPNVLAAAAPVAEAVAPADGAAPAPEAGAVTPEAKA